MNGFVAVALKHISSLVHHFLDFFFSLPFFSLLFFAAGLSPRFRLELGERLLDVGRDGVCASSFVVFLLHLVRQHSAFASSTRASSPTSK